jgi:cbb3-type cytochrome c oxidase subunit III
MSKPLSRALPAILAACCALAGPVQAEDMDLPSMLKIIDQRLHDKTATADAIEAGRERAILCQYCHGADGNSLKPDVPNLAGQNARYLLDQIDKFARGSRKDYVMNQLADNFTAEDKINVAIFYYSMAVKPQAVDKQLAAKGKALFDEVCSDCHGAQGHGNQKLARLAGQQTEYVKLTLQTFRGNASSPGGDNGSKRRSATMEAMAKDLTDAQIAAVAAYVAQLP